MFLFIWVNYLNVPLCNVKNQLEGVLRVIHRSIAWKQKKDAILKIFYFIGKNHSFLTRSKRKNFFCSKYHQIGLKSAKI